MFKTLFDNLINVLVGMPQNDVTSSLSVSLSLICVLLVVMALFRLILPNSKKVITIITVILVVMICVSALGYYNIPIVRIEQYLPTGGTV